MHLERVSVCTDELASAIGPVETLLALARLEDALADLDDATDRGVVDLGAARVVLDEMRPRLARAEVRIADLRSAMNGL